MINVSEHDECITLVAFLNLLQATGKVLRFTKIPNETYTKSWGQKWKNKQEGVHKGFSDYVVITKNKLLMIEMKRVKGGQVSPEQEAWVNDAQGKTVGAKICKGFESAKLFIEENLV